MPTRILSQFAVVVALFISGVSLDLQADSALAGDCLAVPNTSAPQGQHWYYRIDRSSHRKCWYLHATLAVLHRAAFTRAERYRPPASTGVAASRDLAEGAPSLPDAPRSSESPRLPEFQTFAERLHSMLSASATSEAPRQQLTREESDPPSIPPQSTTDSVRPDAGRFIASDAEGAAERGVDAGKAGAAGALRLILFLLVPGLAVAGFLVPVVVRVVSRRPIDVPETAWIEHQSFHDRSNAGGQQKPQEHGYGSCVADPQSREQSAGRHHRIKEPPSALSRRSKTRSQHLAAAAAKSVGQNAEGIERALRAIRQARQQRTA